MSVLQRKELEGSPLADLHVIASELGLEGYRSLRKAQLIDAILGLQGEADGNGAAAVEEPVADEEAPAVEADADDETDEEAPPERPSRRRRRSGRGRRAEREADGDEEPVEDEPSVEKDSAEDSPAEDESPAEEERLVTGVLDILPNGSGFVRGDGDEAYISPAQIRRCELRAGDEVSGPVRPAAPQRAACLADPR